jgi:hypothetical protein
MSVRAGSNHRTADSDNVQTLAVAEWFVPDVHELYQDLVHVNDIALLRLEAPGFVFDAHVRPICLPPPDSASVTTAPTPGGCLSAGWGGTSFTNRVEEIPDLLQQASMLELSTQRCNDRLKEISFDEYDDLVKDDSMICAGTLDGSVGNCFVSMLFPCLPEGLPNFNVHCSPPCN